MGAGKSTLGEKAAQLSGRPFVDLDREIERRHAPVAELFERGEPEFRRIEAEVAAEVLSSPEPAVIALGGGAVIPSARATFCAAVPTRSGSRSTPRRPGSASGEAIVRLRGTKKRSGRSSTSVSLCTTRSPPPPCGASTTCCSPRSRSRSRGVDWPVSTLPVPSR
jgi:Shikimate kinase